MGAAGHRLERQPGELLRRGLRPTALVRDGVARVLLGRGGRWRIMLSSSHSSLARNVETGPAAAAARRRPAPSRFSAPSGERKFLPARPPPKRVLATSRQPDVSLSSRCTSRGRWPSFEVMLPRMPSMCRRCRAALHAEAPSVCSAPSRRRPPNSVMDFRTRGPWCRWRRRHADFASGAI